MQEGEPNPLAALDWVTLELPGSDVAQSLGVYQAAQWFCFETRSAGDHSSPSVLPLRTWSSRGEGPRFWARRTGVTYA